DAWKAWAFTIYTTLAYYVVLVLFGAPIATHLPHTALLASLLAILTVFIPAYALGPPVLPLPFLSQSTPSAAVVLNDTWVRVFAERKPHSAAERALLYPALGAVVGAWTGVIPIGLDWDRPWQAYPLTPAYGAALGYTIGALSALVVSGTVFLAAQDVDRTAEQVAVKNKNQKAKERKKRGKELKEA
ncbi:PIG-F-domain-containing protein, partial [Artomyces pyxidatus]